MPFDLFDSPSCADDKPYTPLHNELVFVFDHGSNTEQNFKYIYRIKDAVTGNILATIRQFPEPVNGYGVIDVHRVLENYISSQIEANDDGFHTGTTLAWKVDFGYESGEPVVVNYDIHSSDTYYGWDATIPHLEYIGFDSSDYVANTTTTSPLTTETEFRIRPDAGAWLYTLVDTDKAVTKCVVKTYNEQNVIQGVYERTNPYTPASGNNRRLLRVPVGTRQLPSWNGSNSTASFGSFPILTDNVHHYKVYFYGTGSPTVSWDFSSIADSSGNLDTTFPYADTTVTMTFYGGYLIPSADYTTVSQIIDALNNALNDDAKPTITAGSSDQVSATSNPFYGDIVIDVNGTVYTIPMVGTTSGNRSKEITYTLLDEVCRYPQHNIVFRNYLGGFDSIQITQAPHNTSKTKRETYQRVTGNLTGNQWGYTAKDRGHTIYHSLSTKSVKGSTTWLNDNEWEWIEQLLQSPEVYEEMEVNGTWSLVPIVITTDNYTQHYSNADSLQQLTIEYKYAHKQNPLK